MEAAERTASPTKPADSAPWTKTSTFPKKSPTTALVAPLSVTLGVLALGGSLVAAGVSMKSLPLSGVGILVGSAGLTVGPSVGHFYTGDRRAGFFLAGRGLLFGGAAFATGFALSRGLGCSENCPSLDAEWAIAGACLVASLGLGIVEIALSPGSADRYNARDREEGPRLSIVPTLLPMRAGRQPGAGLVATLIL